ncbi:metal-sensitive transcriptional regulator [Salicibibacter cibarius]|uniref:Transcriptional regulator n=2 Tax=Salicibibacter TaxID=2685905 RepID=A0A514LL64_9BACI|nr:MULTISPECIES: metal-sensitive transcriptional regulator [Salicibibacter]QDI92001.1 transcriptional regulator [Salicibibacter halophilus]QQK74536.1 metal-sensitive transcriptional regulator [Salicibibacter cibarius]
MTAQEKRTVQPNKQELLNRLKRIEGQVRGVQKMIDEDKYCVDILHQISAIQSAMKKVSIALMEDHTNHCVANAIQEGNKEEMIDELMDVMKRLM